MVDPVGVGAGVGVGEVEAGDVFQFVVKVVVVSPFVFDPERETGGVTVCVWDGVKGELVGVGVVLAEVLEVLCVLDVPPLTDGSTLIMGWTLITGWTVIVALLEALCMMVWPCRSLLPRWCVPDVELFEVEPLTFAVCTCELRTWA